MLTRLSIRNIVLIEALDLDFGGGLGVLTGETGAGKSILLDALGLALGDRADLALLGAAEDNASVAATFEFLDLPANLREILKEAEVELHPGEPLILRRMIRAPRAGERTEDKGVGSRAFVNDQQVSVALLREIGGVLVEIHGQNDDRGLLNPSGHRALLDRFAGADIAGVERTWVAYRKAREALDTASARVEGAARDKELLKAHLAELAALQPREGEEQELAMARATMQKGEKLADDLADLQRLWAGSDSALATLRGAAKRLGRIAGEHELLAEALAALDRAVIEAGEAEEKLERAAELLTHNPEVLDRLETRLFDLRALARKHECGVDELPAKMRELQSTLDAIEGGSDNVAMLELAALEAGNAYFEKAEALRQARYAAGGRLDRAVNAELEPLKLDNASFMTVVNELPMERWSGTGMDSVEFLISTNPDADFAPLARIASGGELARFILALKAVLAEQGGIVTAIFDEIDTGVSGAVASAIGERLARLAERGQLLAVTHSPQVAARGDTHYLIEKSSEGTVTRTSVSLLDAGGRREEIARMLSGAQVTDEARAQADQLLKRG